MHVLMAQKELGNGIRLCILQRPSRSLHCFSSSFPIILCVPGISRHNEVASRLDDWEARHSKPFGRFCRQCCITAMHVQSVTHCSTERNICHQMSKGTARLQNSLIQGLNSEDSADCFHPHGSSIALQRGSVLQIVDFHVYHLL